MSLYHYLADVDSGNGMRIISIPNRSVQGNEGQDRGEAT